MITEQLVWAIFFIPLASFCILALVVRPFFNSKSHFSGPIAVLSIGISFILSVMTLIAVTSNKNLGQDWGTHSWLKIGDHFHFTVGILLDPLTAIMLVVVTGVSLMVQIYSMGYMKPSSHESGNREEHQGPEELGNPVYARYFAYMSLFTASMLGLVMAANVVQMFVFWELVGLCSYLLIGFWFHRPAAAAAAKKAFIITRVGDFGFLIALMYLFFKTVTEKSGNYLEISVINSNLPGLVDAGVIAGGALTLITLGMFIGAIGKSGQFPLHTWLPDAMEGPTPVSALIHAATMVTAGVFLVARFFPIFEHSPDTMTIVTIIGGVTAIFAATMGLVSNDIKRVLAYSTVSQLGYMMLALGVGAYGPAIFHLFTHAFFKALLFLGSGSVNHATGTFDMRYMGGLRKKMPITYITFLIGSLSLAGIFPLAGFWSKDEILLNAFKHGDLISMMGFLLAIIAVFMTAFYMFRALFMTFEGDFRGGSERDPEAQAHGPVHLAESPFPMVLPMIILAIPAVIIGFLVNPIFDIGIPKHWLTNEFLGKTLESTYHVHIAHHDFSLLLAIISLSIALLGILLAWAMYKQNPYLAPSTLGRVSGPIYTLLLNKYYFDEAYEQFITGKIYYRGIARVSDWIDRNIVDRIVNIVGWLGANFGSLIRELQTGQTQMYATVTSVGIIIIAAIYLFGM